MLSKQTTEVKKSIIIKKLIFKRHNVQFSNY